jgi:CheY-like chemotaxis protein
MKAPIIPPIPAALPCWNGLARKVPADCASARDLERNPMSILYVEDDPLTRETIARRLRRRGFHVVEVASGEQALELASDGLQIKVALLDVDLPGINGIETLRRLRKHRPTLPAVVCSASLPLGLRQPFRELGVSDNCLLSKPCPFAELLVALEYVTVGHEH